MTVQVSLGNLPFCATSTKLTPVLYFPDKALPAPPSPTAPLLCWEEWQPPCHPPPYRQAESGSGPKRAWEENALSSGPSPGPATKRARSGVATRSLTTLSSSSETLPPQISHSTRASSRSARHQHQQHPPQLGLSATPWYEKPGLRSDEAARTNESTRIPRRQYQAPNLVPYHKLVLHDRRGQTTIFKHNKAAFQQHEHHMACIKALLSKLNKACDQLFRGVKPDTPRIFFQSMARDCCCHD